MLGTAGARLDEELRQLKLEGQRLHEQLLDTKRLIVNAGKQRGSCRSQVELLNRELEDAKSHEGECVALVDEQECFSPDLVNVEEDIRKLRSRVKTEQTSRKVIRRRVEAINAQNLFSRPPNLYELLFLPQGAKTTTILKDYKKVVFAVSSGQGWSEGSLQDYLAGEE